MDPDEFWKLLTEEKCLSSGLLHEFISIYGDRGQKALDAYRNGKVRRYQDFVVVAGSSKEYIVEEDFCTCQDFLFRGRCCWHLLAARLAAACGGYDARNEWYQEKWHL